jgi:hypothetical protein
MKTIKGYNLKINEGILSSTKSGKSSTIEEFLKTMFYNERYYEKVQNEIDVYNIKYDYDFTKIDMIPFWVKECKSLKFDNCRFSEYVLPEKAEVLTFNNCQHLSKIKTSKKAATTTIDELVLQDCPNIDFTELENITVKQVKIIDCEITTLKGLKGITSKLIIKNCKKLKTYDLECPNIKNIVLYRTPIKSFVKPISALDVSLINLRKVKDLEVLIDNVEDLRIEDCKDLETLKISGNPTDTTVIIDCEVLKSLNIKDCKTSLSLVNLPALENYELPPRITGACIFDEVKTVPEVNCKKKIIR